MRVNQTRVGPNKVGAFGIVQPLVDGGKLFLKQINPPNLVYSIFYFSPFVSFIISIIIWRLVIFSSLKHFLLLLLSCMGCMIYTFILRGWARFSKFGLLGAIRASSQTISYEIRLALLLITVLVRVSSVSLIFWFNFYLNLWVFLLPVFMLWWVTLLAETNRAPFDFREGERELISGFNVEYGRGGFVILFLSEYNIIIFFCFLTSSLFLIKRPLFLSLFLFVFLFSRTSFPRYRYDKLIEVMWKGVLPMVAFSLMSFILLCFNSLYKILFWSNKEKRTIIFHKFHIVTLSPWPIIFGGGVLSLLSSFLSFFFFNYSINIFISLGLSIFILFFWWRDVSRERRMGDHSFEVRDGLKWGMLLFILREVWFFFAWFWAFFHNRTVPTPDIGTVWPPHSVTCLEPFQIPLLNTCVLLRRGVTVTWAHHNLFITKEINMIMLFTIFLGILFTALQAEEYLSSAFCLHENSYGRSFFVTTGFHGSHVLVGSAFLTVCLFRRIKIKVNKWNHLSLEFAIWYWHFVDVVWLFLFFFMYWWSF